MVQGVISNSILSQNSNPSCVLLVTPDQIHEQQSFC